MGRTSFAIAPSNQSHRLRHLRRQLLSTTSSVCGAPPTAASPGAERSSYLEPLPHEAALHQPALRRRLLRDHGHLQPGLVRQRDRGGPEQRERGLGGRHRPLPLGQRRARASAWPRSGTTRSLLQLRPRRPARARLQRGGQPLRGERRRPLPHRQPERRPGHRRTCDSATTQREPSRASNNGYG